MTGTRLREKGQGMPQYVNVEDILSSRFENKTLKKKFLMPYKTLNAGNLLVRNITICALPCKLSDY